MSPEISPLWLFSTSLGGPVSAELWDAITPQQLADRDQEWVEEITAGVIRLIKARVPNAKFPKSLHWDWRRKVAAYEPYLSKAGFSVMCEGATQGLMFVDTALHLCKMDAQAGKNLVYVDFIETAPWNRADFLLTPRYRGVGSVLMRAAIELSKAEEFQGRVGLHSLPESEAFYRDKCGMTDLGTDPKHQSYLRYFEMTPEQADAFIKKGSST